MESKPIVLHASMQAQLNEALERAYSKMDADEASDPELLCPREYESLFNLLSCVLGTGGK